MVDNGVILNNTLNPITSTQLAGLITSNPNFTINEASIILNQVTSSNPSFLSGLLGVAGKKADVLIANPNSKLVEAVVLLILLILP